MITQLQLLIAADHGRCGLSFSWQNTVECMSWLPVCIFTFALYHPTLFVCIYIYIYIYIYIVAYMPGPHLFTFLMYKSHVWYCMYP